MTEDEAKTKWCPMYRAMTPDSAYEFFDNKPDPNADVADRLCCIGSECMAWRWFDAEKMFIGIEDGESVYQKRDERNGYCGLAGVPIR